MNWNPLTWFGQSKATNLTLDQAIQRMLVLRQTVSGEMINPDTALQAPTVFAIAGGLSRAVGMLPFMVEQDESEPGKRKVTRLPEHNLAKLMRKPNAWQTPYEYWSLVMVRLALYGEFYAIKNQASNGRITALVPIAPESVEPQQGNTGKLSFQVTPTNGNAQTIPQDKMHRIVMFSTDGIRGTSPVQRCKETIAMEIASEKFGAATFGSGAIPNVVLSMEGHFKDEDAAKKFKESWQKAFGNKKRGTAVLEDGLKVEPLQMNNEESQFLETRKLQRSVISGAWGVPPHMVGDLERATFSNIEEQTLSMLMGTLQPYLECITDAVDRDLISPNDREAKVSSAFDTKARLKGDMKSRSESLSIQRQNGIISANEWRAMEGMDAREDEGGDDYITPLNFRLEDESGSSDPDDPGTEDEKRRVLGTIRVVA